MKKAFAFLAAWMIPPALMRLLLLFNFLSVLRLEPRPNPGRLVAELGLGMLAGLAQDALIGLEVLALFLALKVVAERLLSPRAVRALPLAALGLFVVAQFYLLFDFQLYTKTGVRVDPAFFDFVPAASSFASSAYALGLGGLMFGALLIVGCTPSVLRWFRAAFESLRFRLWLPLGMAAAAFLAIAFHRGVPGETAYAIDNLLLRDQLRLLARAADPRPGHATDAEALALPLLAPQAETFERPEPRYPLLKRTTGFHGPRQFELSVSPGERPHVVFLFMESFRAADIGVLGGRHAVSPNFDRLSREGVLFRNFYGCGVQTTRAVIASLFGILPPMLEESPQSPGADVPMIGLADLFNRHGYTSAYMTGTSLDFEHQRWFFPRHGYSVVQGDEEIGRAFPKAERTSWGYHDEYLLDHAALWLAEQDRQARPTFLTLFTITHHHPWRVPDHYRAPEFPTNLAPEYRRFLQTFHYSDQCLGRFVQRLVELGLDRRTVVFILADTGTPQGEHHGNFMLVNHLYEENLRIPLLILAPGRLRRPTAIEDVGSQVDLLPTVMDLFHMTGLNHSMGTSLVRRVEGRTAYFNNPFVLQFFGLRRGPDKYIYTVRTRKSALYNLADDPAEGHDLAPLLPHHCDRYRTQADAINRFLIELSVTARLAPPQ